MSRADVLTNLSSEEKRRLLAERLARGAVAGGSFPLSFAQQRLWFLDQLEPGSAAYNVPRAIRMTGDFDREALAGALSEIVRRHESLRTVFETRGGEVVQVVTPAQPLEIPVLDLTGEAAEAREATAVRIASEEARRPFDLARGPFLRASLLRMAPREHILLLSTHHIVSDAWSASILFRELAALYGAFTSGRSSPLQDLAFQYGEFSAWQRNWLRGDVLEEQLGYWRRQLASAPEFLDLPTDRPRPAVQSFGGAHQPFTVPKELADRIGVLSRHEGATPFMTLLSAFAALLYRYTSEPDLVIGSPVANRNRTETEGLIGFFVNTLPLRLRLHGDPTFRSLIARVRDTALGAYDHQDIPFEKLVEEIRPERDMSRNPIVQVMFSLQSAPVALPSLPGLILERVPVEWSVSKFDLYVGLDETPTGLSGAAEFNTDLFDASTVARMVVHFVNLLRAAVAEPDRRISTLSLLSAREERQILSDWNATRADYPGPSSIPELFADQARRAPDATALMADGRRMSYADLDERAERLALRLRAAGVERGDRVGICLERSFEMVIAVLGALKAGAAYVPLDPAYPAARLAFMLEDARPAALVTRGELASRLSPGSATVLRVEDEGGQARLPEESAGPGAEVTPEDAAYLIYTSGSTGVPKGVVGVQRGAVNRLHWMWREYPFRPGEICCLKTSLSFVDSVWEIFGPLLAGVPSVLLPEDVVRDVPNLIEALGREGVTRIVLVPALLRAILEENGDLSARLPRLRLWVSSGEALRDDLVARFSERLPEATLLNLYGSSEASADSTAFNTREAEKGRPVAIGRPIANHRVYLLDAPGNPVPPGAPGEIAVGGDGLARGYWNRPDLTAERFRPDPFARDPGGRLYRTGDLGRQRADGTIDYLGRKDLQVKVRGHRIEPAEVEVALSDHPAVKTAVVTARGDGRGGERLIAYVVLSGDAPRDPAPLRSHLKARLPEYMVPSQFVWLEELPLTPNGKVDRKGLPDPDVPPVDTEAMPERSRSPVEEIVAAIFADVLGLARVGAGDDFFALGGHSLLATRVASRIREAFQIPFPLRILFDAPTPAGVAEQIERGRQRVSDDVPLRPIPRASRADALPLSFAQQRLWFLQQWDPKDPSYNVPLAIRIVGPLDRKALQVALDVVVARHESLRTTFPSPDGIPLQVIAPTAALPLERVEAPGPPGPDREREVMALAVAEARRPFDLERGPLIRARLVALEDEENVLLLTLHHTVADAWSLGVLAREIGESYAASARGVPPALPPVPLQYADYAVWERERLNGPFLAELMAYWKGQLADLPDSLELPFDRPRPAIPSRRGARERMMWEGGLAARAEAFSRREGVTLFMTLMAAFQALLHRYTGESEIAVGTATAGRSRPELEGVVGCFINTLVLRGSAAGDPTFRAFVKQIRETALDAYAHQELPFEMLVEALRPERSLSHAPLFQVLFLLGNVSQESLEIPGATLTPFSIDVGTAKFDLTIGFWKEGDRLAVDLEYSTDLFDRDTVRRLLEHLRRLLEAAIADPEQRLSRLPMLGESEREEVLFAWNRTKASYPRDRSVPELFEMQVERTPDATALVCGDEGLSYRDLNRRANRLAHHLRDLGVEAEVLVGLCVERSVDLVVAILGILKAGGAYVPLDSQLPTARLSHMLQDSGARLVVTQGRLVSSVPAIDAIRKVLVDQLPDSATDDGNVSSGVAAQNLANLIYTSGSTGVPKGVLVSHRSLVNLLSAMRVEPGLAPTDVLPAVTTLSFDIAGLELFLPLITGARLALVSREEASDGDLLAARLHACGGTVLQATPATWRMLVESGWEGDENLRVLCGGEALPAELAQALQSRSAAVWNLYGPTETTIWSAVHPVRGSQSGWVPIGRPIANTQMYVLGRSGQPSPGGVAGELHIGGDGLARGYRNRPDITAEKFVPDPFGDPGARLYKTGDLARFQKDGSIEYRGRLDHQVKIRGFRVEPGEIEARLLEHPSVRDAVVTARVYAGQEERLVAYLVRSDQEGVAGGVLRSFLKDRVPDYMVPSAYVWMDAIPLNANGKVDRKSLPDPASGAPEPEEKARPSSPLEDALAEAFAAVLGRARVGATQDFFDLGGHSLLATQLVSRIRKLLRIELPLRLIFEAPTVAGLALAISQHQAERLDSTELANLLAEIEDEAGEDVRGTSPGPPRAASSGDPGRTHH